jgi:hypothetical protein
MPPRSSALFVIVLGLLTFFAPLVTLDRPVLDTTHWSAFQIVWEMYQGNLHAYECERCGEPQIRALAALPVSITAIYVLMVVALLPLTVPYALDTVAAIAGLGGIISLYLSRRPTAWAFEETFYGRASGVRHVHYVLLQLTLFGVMAGLFLIAIGGDSAKPPPSWLEKRKSGGEG